MKTTPLRLTAIACTPLFLVTACGDDSASGSDTAADSDGGSEGGSEGTSDGQPTSGGGGTAGTDGSSGGGSDGGTTSGGGGSSTGSGGSTGESTSGSTGAGTGGGTGTTGGVDDSTSGTDTYGDTEGPADTDGFDRDPDGNGPGAQDPTLFNAEAVVPSMCYTRTEGRFNPCYVCHQNTIDGEGRENRQGDGILQGDYGFSDFALTNNWTNLFVDRTDAIPTISDADAETYVEDENYTRLISRLRATNPPWLGYIPDLENLHLAGAAFDEYGFARDGSGWVAYNYKPMPSTFWPTNGATDDVMIRLPEKFRTGPNGYSFDIYMANLSILEAAIKREFTITTPPIDEAVVGQDLNGDGMMTVVTEIELLSNYVGNASDEKVHTFLYPEKTEFLHTVRYVGVDGDGNIYVPPHMKELRYMIKDTWYPKSTLGAFYDQEYHEKIEGKLPYYPDLGDYGLSNKMGWWIRGYLEDADGELRPATYEEGLFCMGCHNAVGSTIDKTFSFARKVTGAEGWKYIDLRGMPDAPNKGEVDGEYLTYLRRVGGGSEFRANEEMQERFFIEGGTQVDEDAVRATADVYELITPSRERALELNKAYMLLVQEQDFIHGRDTVIAAPENVFEVVDPDTVPLEPENRFDWNIIIDW